MQFLYVVMCFTMGGALLASSSSKTHVSADQKAKVILFYKEYLKKTLPNPQSRISWFSEVLPIDLKAKSSGPLEPYYNGSLIWAKDQKGKIIRGFRPIDGMTDCNSGCAPIIFHLVFNGTGQFLDIIEEPEKPLKKLGHAPFTKEDKDKLLTLLQKMPEALEFVDKATDLTENTGAFPPQTWTVFQDVLVKNGAYTCFVVYEAAKHVVDFIKEQDTGRNLKTEQDIKVQSALKKLGACETLAEIKICLRNISPFLKAKTMLGNNTKSLVKRILFALMFNYVSELDEKTMSEHLPFLYEEITRQKHILFVSELNQLNRFLRHLLSFELGAKVILHMEKNMKEWVNLNPSAQKILPFFASLKLGDMINAKKMYPTLPENTIAFIEDDQELLERYFYALVTFQEEEKALKIYGRLRLHFPSFALKDKLGWKVSPTILSEAEKRYQEEYKQNLLRPLYPKNQKIIEIFGKKAGTGKKELIPVKGKKKRIYIFFASWCGHCAETIRDLSTKSSKILLDKIQLVEIFTQQEPLLEAFGDLTGIKKKVLFWYNDIITLPNSKDVEKFYESMNLFATPKVILLNGKGDIVDFDFHLDLHENFERDLNWILEGTES